MSIEIYCDGKNCRAKNMQIFYCEDCYISLEDKLGEAEDTIRELQEQLTKIQ